MNTHNKQTAIILMTSLTLFAYSCSVSFRRTDKPNTDVTGTDNNQLNSRVVISADSPLEVVALDTSTPLSATGTGVTANENNALSATLSIISPIGSGLDTIESGISASRSQTIRATSFTDLSSTINISFKYFGSDALEYCSVNSPFSSIECIIGATTATMTRQNISDLMGDSASATFSVSVGATSSLDTTSNALTVNKHKITQISGLNSDGSDNPISLTVYNGALYFSANSGSGNYKLYKYDGTGITQISNINSGGDDWPDRLTVYNNALYFSAKDSSAHSKLYKYNGTSIAQISDINSGDNDSPIDLIVYEGELYFSALSGDYYKLYKYDGYSITQLSNIVPSGGDFTSSLSIYNGNLYFSAFNGNVITLYKYDKTNIIQISSVCLFFDLYTFDTPNAFVEYNGALYIKADSNPEKYKLYKYDGTSITQISNINTSGDDAPSYITVYNDKLYFSANNSSAHSKLYKYDGTSITQISDIHSGDNDSPSQLKVYNDALYFSANNSSAHSKLYKYDGTSIIQISDIYSGGSDDPSSFTEYNGALYFSANNGSGYKLYKFE